MNILDVCNDLSILGVILFIKNLLKIICVAVPILLLLFLTIDFTKATIESDSEKMNKVKAIAIKRIVYAIIVFLVPVIVNGVMSLLGDSTNFSSCYDMANNDNVQSLAEANKLEQDAKKAKTEQAKKELDEKVKKIYAQIRENRKKQGNGGTTKGYYSNVFATQYKKASGIAEATGGERGLRNNKAGDQTGTEVRTGGFRGSGWVLLARSKDPAKAEIIARCMEDCAKNNHIGYDQADRTSLYEEAKKKNWNIPSITNDVETTCSSVASVCINAAGIEFPKLVYADSNPTMQSLLKKNNNFIIITDKSKMKSTKDVRRGDVLCTNSHTAVAI